MKKQIKVVNARRMPFDLLEESSDSVYKREYSKSPNNIISGKYGLYRSKDRRVVRAIIWDSLISLNEIYPKVFEYFVNNKKNWQVQAWATEGNPEFSRPRTILMRMNYKHIAHPPKIPDTIANSIRDEHTRLCAVFLHEIGEAILWHKGRRDSCDFGIPDVSEYAKTAKTEAFCEALAFVIITRSTKAILSRSELDFIDIDPKGSLDNAFNQMNLK